MTKESDFDLFTSAFAGMMDPRFPPASWMRGQSNALSPSKSAAGVKSAANLSLSCKFMRLKPLRAIAQEAASL
jgi:hypothetical protein